VHDTLPIEYNTTIAATNALGESSVEIVGWSDPDESSWTVGSGGNVWNGNVTVLNTTIVRSTEYVELRQYVDDYVSYWRFDENTGTLLHDENGTNTLDASAFNTTWNSSGKYGIAVEFDGSTSYAYVSDSTNSPLDITDSITVSAWVYQHQATAQQMFVDKGYYRYVIASETAPTFYGYIDITGANSPTALPLNSWQYTTMTWNGSVIKVYENGAYKGQTNKADAITTDNNDLRFGKSLYQ